MVEKPAPEWVDDICDCGSDLAVTNCIFCFCTLCQECVTDRDVSNKICRACSVEKSKEHDYKRGIGELAVLFLLLFSMGCVHVAGQPSEMRYNVMEKTWQYARPAWILKYNYMENRWEFAP